MTQLVFCHGFGFNIYYWEHLASFFTKEACHFIDLGYFTGPNFRSNISYTQPIIGIGHSLGLLKLVHMYKNFKCLIGLNSFTNFLGNNKILYKKRQIELQKLQNNFIQDPKNTLKKFYKRCGTSTLHNYYDSLDLEGNLKLNLILSDIDLLKNNYTLPSVPTLILASNDDIIVPKEIVEDNFCNSYNIQADHITLKMLSNGQHALGHQKPLEVYEIITRFLDDKVFK